MKKYGYNYNYNKRNNYKNEKDNFYEDYSFNDRNYNMKYKSKKNYNYKNNHYSGNFSFNNRPYTYKTKRSNYFNNDYRNNNYNNDYYYNEDYYDNDYYYNNNYYSKNKNNFRNFKHKNDNKNDNNNNHKVNNIFDNNINKNDINNVETDYNNKSNKIVDTEKEKEENINEKGNVILNDKEELVKENKPKFPKYKKIISKFVNLYRIVKAPIESLSILDNYNDLIINLKKKILKIFNSKEIKEEYLYQKLLKIFQDKDSKIYSSSKLFDIVIFYIQKNISLINDSEEIQKIAFDYFINDLSKISIDLYEKYIIIFHIQEKLSKYFETKENIINLKNSLLILKILNLHNRISFDEFNLFIEKDNINYILIIQLFQVYNRTEDELLNLYKYIISKIPKNSIPIIHLKSLLDDDTFKNDFKKLLIDNLLELPKEIDEKSYNSFFDDKLIYLIYNLKYYDTAIKIIKNFDDEKIKSLDKKILKDLLYSIDLLDINNIIFLIGYLPEEFNSIVKKYQDNNNNKNITKTLKKKLKKSLNKLVKKINI